jgi:hypothetical protein
MGGPGSGNPGGRRVGNRWARELDDFTNLSRVELEHVAVRDVVVGTPDALSEAAAIRAELATRTWQWTNPYA